MDEAVAETPVLMTVFNRPGKARRVLDAVRVAAPRRLYVAGDGPRPHVPTDAARCQQTRRLFDDVGWECDVKTLFRDENLGCKIGMSTAISWFLSLEGEGIILEDDCVPSPDFFPFCAELLERYRDVDEVMMIGGNNQLGEWGYDRYSYTFTQTTPIWGWATWDSAWATFDASMSAWADPAVRAYIRSTVPLAEYRSMSRQFDNVSAGRLDSWGNAWAFAMLRRSGLAAVAGRNLVENIGFDAEATHTKNRLSPTAKIPAASMDFPLVHPPAIEPSHEYDEAMFRVRFPLSRRIVSALPWSIQGPVRAVLQQATVVISGTMKMTRALLRSMSSARADKSSSR